MNSGEIKKTIVQYYKEMQKKAKDFDEEELSLDGKWMKKEILGHLIDSTFNNLQRIIRLNYEELPFFSDYDQDKWVSIQQYRKVDFINVLFLWYNINKHLLWVIEQLELDFEEKHKFNNSKQSSLQEILDDYISHMNHHIGQILSNDRECKE